MYSAVGWCAMHQCSHHVLSYREIPVFVRSSGEGAMTFSTVGGPMILALLNLPTQSGVV